MESSIGQRKTKQKRKFTLYIYALTVSLSKFHTGGSAINSFASTETVTFELIKRIFFY